MKELKKDKKNREIKIRKLFVIYKKFINTINVLKSKQTKILKVIVEKRDKQKADDILKSINGK